MRRKRKSKVRAPAVVYYTRAKNEEGVMQLCVGVECIYGGTRFGPVWGHSTKAVNKALATLSGICGCGRRYHKKRFTEGHRVMTTRSED